MKFLLFVSIVGIPLVYLIPISSISQKPNSITQTAFMIKKSGPNAKSNWMPLNRINPIFICSLIKSEDRMFFRHGGLDFSSIYRTAIANFQKGRLDGASTITQQLSKNILGNVERSLSNKVVEVFYSLLLELNFSKLEILEKYINSIEFGYGVWGIKNASSFYFKKKPDFLSLDESLVIVSTLPFSGNADSKLTASRRESLKRRIRFQLLKSRINIDNSLNFSEVISNECGLENELGING